MPSRNFIAGLLRRYQEEWRDPKDQKQAATLERGQPRSMLGNTSKEKMDILIQLRDRWNENKRLKILSLPAFRLEILLYLNVTYHTRVDVLVVNGGEVA
jgi:hypothetical protein